MIARTEEFKEEIKKLGKQIDFKILVYPNYNITTEDEKLLITENNIQLITEQINETGTTEAIQSEDIYNVSVVRKGNLLSTMMKEIDFDIKQEIKVGDIIDCSFGLKVNDNYEWINYGRYIIYSKEFNEDTKTYSYVAYDSMLLSMITFDDRSLVENVSVKTAIENICNKIGLSVNITAQDEIDLPNLNKIIHQDTFKDIEMTYRDVLDMICQCLGITMVSNSNTLYLKTINRTPVDEFNAEYLKDINVKFGEKYGPINSVVLSRSEDNDNLYRKDDESIALNGLYEFKIKDNLIMLYDDREDYIDEIFNQLNGLEYYINDFTSTGITYLEPLDIYDIAIDDNTYQCLLLNDEIKINQGLEETIYTEKPEETTTDYKTSGKTDKEVSFIVDKQNGNIKAKVSKGEVINEINLDESGATIRANKVNLVGYVTASDLAGTGTTVINGANITTGTINADKINGGSITASAINLGNNNFAVTTDGYLTAKRVNIIGGNIALQSNEITDNISVGGTSSSTGETIESRMGWGNFYLYRGGTSKVALYTGSTTQIGGQIRLYDASHNNPISLNGATGNITCISLTQTSLEEQKKNFEKYDNALDTIKNINIYKYNYINEDDNYKKHIGFVIGEQYKYSSEITSIDEDNKENGVDLYSFVSVCCKAIQEQQEIIENLITRIEKLEKENDK